MGGLIDFQPRGLCEYARFVNSRIPGQNDPFVSPIMEETSLKLLASDGPIGVTFRPMLTTAQYNELAEFVIQGHSRTRQEFYDQFAQLAAEWNVKFQADF